MTHSSTEGRDYYRLALILGALTAIGPLAIDMYLPSLPTIAREFGTTAAAVQASLAAYYIGIAIGQALYGPLSDRVGRKPALYLGLGVFLLSSIGCARAAGVQALVTFRFLQALGGCAPIVVPRAVVRDYFDQQGSVRMLSLLMLVFGLAPILAPLIGGQLLINFGWRSVFWVLATYAATWLTLVAIFLPESLPRERRQRQPIGVVLSTYAQLARDRVYMGYALSGALIFAGLLAYIAGSPFVFIEIFRVPPERFGFYFGTNAFGIIAASQINRWLSTRMDPHRILRIMLVVAMSAGLLMFVNAWSGFGGFAGILIPLFCFISSHGFVLPNTTALAMAPHGRVAGSASALLGTLQFVLGTTSAALVGAFANGTAVPLAAVIAGCGVTAFLTHVVGETRSAPSLSAG
ncbi:MAG TPA: Bcr/CflA family multidrug efflux MFS transporter [Vicinamibacterales bacterium]|nr:Bcr/CflA family multidrug efflux MFS transporter [Vicinamibacterales bacterium]